MIEESNKFLVFKYSEGDAVLEITLKEMPFSLFATAYLIKVPARCDDEVHDDEKVEGRDRLSDKVCLCDSSNCRL